MFLAILRCAYFSSRR